MSKRLEKIRSKWPDVALLSLPGVPQNMKADVIFHAVTQADKTQGHKCVDWLLKSWRGGAFQWEDIKAGASSRVSDQIMRFDLNKQKIEDVSLRSLMKYKSPGELDAIMDKLGVPKEISEFDLSSNQTKKLLMAKARLESQHFETESGIKFDIPLTQFASCILGRNTRWCTAARDDNEFFSYAETGPLFIITLPTGERFQAHVDTQGLYSFTIMDDNDVAVRRTANSPIRPFAEEIADKIVTYISDTKRKKGDIHHKCILNLKDRMIQDMAYNPENQTHTNNTDTYHQNVMIEQKNIEDSLRKADISGLSVSYETAPQDDKKYLTIRLNHGDVRKFMEALTPLIQAQGSVYRFIGNGIRYINIIPDIQTFKDMLEYVEKHDAQKISPLIYSRIQLSKSDITPDELSHIYSDKNATIINNIFQAEMTQEQSLAICKAYCDARNYKIDTLEEKSILIGNFIKNQNPPQNINSAIAVMFGKEHSIDTLKPTEFAPFLMMSGPSLMSRDHANGNTRNIEAIYAMSKRFMTPTPQEQEDFLRKYSPDILDETQEKREMVYRTRLINIMTSVSMEALPDFRKDIKNYLDLKGIMKEITTDNVEPGKISDILLGTLATHRYIPLIIKDMPEGSLSEKERNLARLLYLDDLESIIPGSVERVLDHVSLDAQEYKKLTLSRYLPMTPQNIEAITTMTPDAQAHIKKALEDEAEKVKALEDCAKELCKRCLSMSNNKPTNYRDSYISVTPVLNNIQYGLPYIKKHVQDYIKIAKEMTPTHGQAISPT